MNLSSQCCRPSLPPHPDQLVIVYMGKERHGRVGVVCWFRDGGFVDHCSTVCLCIHRLSHTHNTTIYSTPPSSLILSLSHRRCPRLQQHRCCIRQCGKDHTGHWCRRRCSGEIGDSFNISSVCVCVYFVGGGGGGGLLFNFVVGYYLVGSIGGRNHYFPYVKHYLVLCHDVGLEEWSRAS